ncbi:hypothetical protein TSAR_004709 [Trichomalopsis sarcophagae]|uniref:Uncharacterized protein n=1 Tax=Trichomalopsis sarcophagae TaxID=543379 RepID=A0A232FL16_9HYME|nr:hypothetical protein TSAR_004709 [Trichomalopsis sarcophagae]
MRRIIILMIVGILIVGSCDGANLRRVFRSKRAESDFILRSCTASAQLIRKNRNEGSQLPVENSNLPKLASESFVLDRSKNKNVNFNKRFRLHTRSKGRHLTDQNITDTPLGTVDVKTIQKETPKLFKKRDPLPELDRHGNARNLDSDAPIILVQPLKH